MSLGPSSRHLAFLLGSILLLATVKTAAAQTLSFGANAAGGSGAWDTSTLDWYNGSANVPWTNGDAAVFGGTAGTVSIAGSITASQVTFSTAGYTIQNFFLLGTSSGLTIETDADATFTSSIFGTGASNTVFTKTGTGLLLLNGGSTPVFFSTISVANGELRYGGATLNSSLPFVLGNTSTAALTFAASTGYVGSLGGGGTTGGIVRPSGTSGSFTLAIGGVGDATYGGTLAGNGNATLSLQKNGASTQTLTNTSSSLTGTTTVSGGKLVLAGSSGALPGTTGVVLNTGGTLQLDNTAAASGARLASTVPVTLNGGTLSFLGNGSQDVSQTVGALNVATGASAVSVATAGSGVAQVIFSKPVVRTPGATVGFSDGGHITLTGASNVNGILGAYATVGADWAAVDANGNVSAYAGYSSDTTTASTTDNLRVTTAGGTTSLASVQSRNSLNLVNTGTAAATIDLGTNGSPVLTSGGLLTSGAGGFVIQSGKLFGGNSELVVTNQAALTINSTIDGSALTKSGPGTLVLGGSNTYTGTTTVNQGTVQVSTDANLGTGTTVALSGGGTLQATAGFTSTKSLQGTGGTIDTGGNTVTFSGKTNTGSFTKIGTGILGLTGQVGSVSVNGGTLQLVNLTGTTTSAVTLNGARLEAGPNGLQTLTTTGTSPVVSPGPHGQAQELDLAYFNALAPTVIDFDLGSAGSDLLSVTYNLNLSTGTTPGLLFRFNSLGGVQTGTAYPLLRLPSSQAFAFGTSGFGIDMVSTAAGYKGVFSIVNGTVDVTFSAVPEPSAAVALSCGGLALWGAAGWRRRRVAREKSAI